MMNLPWLRATASRSIFGITMFVVMPTDPLHGVRNRLPLRVDARLARIEFDNQLLIKAGVDIPPLGILNALPAERLNVSIQPARKRPALGHFRQLLEIGAVARAGPHLDDVARANEHRRHVRSAPVHVEVPMGDQEPRLGPVDGEAQPEDGVVESPLQGLEQVLARQTTPLPAVVGQSPAAELCIAPVVARGEPPALKGALRGEASLALEEELFAFSPAEPTDRSDVLCHTVRGPALRCELPARLRLAGEIAVLDSALLGRATSVVRHRCDVRDRAHPDPRALDRPNGRFAPRPRALDQDLEDPGALDHGR